MAGIVPESWLGRGLGTGGDLAQPTSPEADMPATHDATTTDLRKTEQNFGKLVNRCRHSANTFCLNQLPETVRPPGPDDPLGESSTKSLAKARQKSLQGQ